MGWWSGLVNRGSLVEVQEVEQVRSRLLRAAFLLLDLTKKRLYYDEDFRAGQCLSGCVDKNR